LTILKLRDGLGFTDALIDFGAGPAQFFRNAVRDLTLDIGSGNPQASGLKFNASNQGTVANVRIRAPAGEGNVGLDLSHSGEIGPLLVRDVIIESFGLGIWSRYQTASQTYENITLSGQREAGWLNSSAQDVYARNVTSTNTVPAIVNGPLAGRDNTGEGLFVLFGGQLNNPMASGGTAIRNQKAMFLKGVKAQGYSRIVSRDLVSFRGNETDVSTSLFEYWANGKTADRRGGAISSFDTIDATIDLPVLETPEVPLSALDTWASPLSFGGALNDAVDDTAAIQAAIDSGAETVFLPRGRWLIEGTVELRGSVRRLIGTEATVTGKGIIRIADGSACVVVIERIEQPVGNSIRIEHASRRTLVLQNMLIAEYAPTIPNAGRVFIRDVVMRRLTFRNQEVWARQLNLEGSAAAAGFPRVLNDNSRVWILGMKTEDDGTDVQTVNGGLTEVYGGLHVGAVGTAPRLETIDASVSAVGLRGGVGTLNEVRGLERRTIDQGLTDFHSSLSPQALVQLGIVFVDNGDARFSTTGTWTSTTSFPGGFAGADAVFTREASASATFAFNVPSAASYEVFARWMTERSGQNHSGHSQSVPYTIRHAQGTSTVTVNQQQSGGDFISLGTFVFDPSLSGQVVINGSAAGSVMADAVMLRRR
jgi:hypothetical protein